MKYQSNWSYAGYFAGGIFSLFSAIRYFLLYPDLDRALVYVGIGIMVMGLAWLYSQNLDTHNRLEAIEEYLEDKNG